LVPISSKKITTESTENTEKNREQRKQRENRKQKKHAAVEKSFYRAAAVTGASASTAAA
jgi:cell division protein FtsL